MTNKKDVNQPVGSPVNQVDRCPNNFLAEVVVYEIHVKGHLSSQWSDWLEGLEVRLLENGEMILWGPIVDQAALSGVLNKLSRLNLALLSVNEVNTNERKNEHRTNIEP